MTQNNGTFVLLLAGIIVIGATLFIASGGELGGKKTVTGDEDLPPVASETAPGR